jgi:hypothetical protein
MNKQTQGAGQGLAGTQPYGSVEGARHISSTVADYHGKGVEHAPPSGIPYGGVHYGKGLCQASTKKEEQCKAPKANDTNYCIGHLRQFKKMGEKQDAALDPKD